MVRPEGIEPPAYRFEACRSIHLSYGRVHRSIGRERLTSVVHVNGRHNRIGVLESGVRLDAVFCADLLHDSLRAGSSIGRAADS